jgi:hypothetical protein
MSRLPKARPRSAWPGGPRTPCGGAGRARQFSSGKTLRGSCIVMVENPSRSDSDVMLRQTARPAPRTSTPPCCPEAAVLDGDEPVGDRSAAPRPASPRRAARWTGRPGASRPGVDARRLRRAVADAAPPRRGSPVRGPGPATARRAQHAAADEQHAIHGSRLVHRMPRKAARSEQHPAAVDHQVLARHEVRADEVEQRLDDVVGSPSLLDEAPLAAVLALLSSAAGPCPAQWRSRGRPARAPGRGHASGAAAPPSRRRGARMTATAAAPTGRRC